MKITAILRYSILCNFLIFVLPAISNAQWRNSTPYIGAFNDINFPDQLTGYACGVAGGIGNCTNNSSILKTMDGGKNWVRLNTGSTTAMNKLQFLDAYTGWGLGETSTVIKTTDGGMSWVTQTFGIGAGLNDFSFPTATTGYVAGLNGILRKSTNGGGTWTTIASGVTGTIAGVSFVTANLGFFAASNGVIRKTTNGGTSWQTVYSGTEFLKDIHFIDANNGIAMSVTRFLITNNGGSSWTPVNTDPSSVLLRMQLINNNLGFALNSANELLKTTNNGATWSVTSVPTEYSLKCIFMFNQQKGYFGANIGQIVTTEDGGNTIFGLTSGLIGQVESLHFRNRTRGILVSANGGILNTQNAGLNFGKRITGTTANLSAVQWLTDSEALVVGDSGVILKTYDAGLTFTRIQTQFNIPITNVWAVDSLYAYAALSSGKVLKTIDAGETWTFQSTLATFSFFGIHFLNRNIGMVVGGSQIYKTNNGGASWTPTNTGIALNGDLKDVWMIDANIAYAAGGFGKLYKTTNGGELWEPIFPANNSNAEISEMQFFSADTGYFSRLSSQYVTFNGGANLNSQSTACLANNGGMNTIHLPERGFGFAGGGSGAVFHTMQQYSIYRTYLQDSVFCAGSKLQVGYNASGWYLNTHTFTAQLSDNNGNFDNPTSIGSLVLPLPHTIAAGIITCTLPAGVSGNGFRIRVICDTPNLIGSDNGYDIVISSAVAPLVSIVSPNQTIDCTSSTLNFTALSSAAGLSPTYTWQLNGSVLPVSGNQVTLENLSETSQLIVSIQSGLACAAPTTATDTLNITLGANPETFAGNDTSICAGTAITLGAASSLTASWFPLSNLSTPDSPTTNATPTESTSYILTLTDAAGCSGKDTVNVTVNSIPQLPVITESSGYLNIQTSNSNQITWLLNGEIIPEETNDSLLIFSFGTFTALVTNENECSSTSDAYTVSSVSIKSSADILQNINIRQQGNSLLFSGLREISTGNITLFDISGRKMCSLTLTLKEGFVTMSLPNMSTGIYLVSFQSQGVQVVKKVLITSAW